MRYLSFFLCLKYLGSRRIVILSIAAVAMSCALLITVASLFTGFIHAVENGAGEHLGDIILVAPSGVKITEYDKLVEELGRHPAIKGATSVLTSQGLLLLGQGDVRAVKIWGIDLASRGAVSSFDEYLIDKPAEGEAASFVLDGTEVEMGGFVGIGVVARPDDNTDAFDVDAIRSGFIGRKVMLTTGTIQDASLSESGPSGDDSAASGSRFRRRTVKFNITNIVQSGMYEFDDNFVYLPIDQLGEKLYPGMGRVADTIQIRLADGADIDDGLAAVDEIWRAFAKDRFNWYRFAKIESSRQMQAVLIAEYRKQMGMLMLIFGIVSGGVILLIFCIFYLIVMTRQKDIAIVKSCGLGSGNVAMTFVLFGFSVGVVGSAFGVGLGYLVTKNVNTIEQWISGMLGLKLWKSSTYMFTRIPTEVNWHSVWWVVAAAALAASLGALIPAITAARVRPVRILRYE